MHEIFGRSTLIFGCGNPLFRDDGFGPAVIEYLHAHCDIPDHVAALDVGTAASSLLFDVVLMPKKPRCLFIVDAVMLPGHAPGELFEIDFDQIPRRRKAEFSLHQFPSVDLLIELRRDAGVEVRILAVQAKVIPDEVADGLSAEVEAAVPRACGWLLNEVEAYKD